MMLVHGVRVHRVPGKVGDKSRYGVHFGDLVDRREYDNSTIHGVQCGVSTAAMRVHGIVYRGSRSPWVQFLATPETCGRVIARALSYRARELAIMDELERETVK